MTFQFMTKPPQRGLIGLIIVATSLTGISVIYGISRLQPASESQPVAVQNAPTVTKVAALGRLEPEAEVVSIAAPLALDGDRVAQLLVKEGDRVEAGQIIAILDSRAPLADAVAQAKEQVKMAQAKLAQVQAGAKTGEIEAQQAELARIKAEQNTEIEAQKANIARLEAEKSTEIEAQKAIINQMEAQFANAKIEYERHETLFLDGAISASLRDSKKLTFLTAQQQLNEAQATLKRIESSRKQQLIEAQATLKQIETSRPQEILQAKATLNQIAEVRPVDIQVAQTEVESAKVALKQAQTNLEQAYIRAPMPGKILKIHTRPGAKIGDSGIVDLAQTDQMIAIAEIYQTDINKVKLGQRAIITSQAFPGELEGNVSLIGLQVSRQNIFSNEPGENLDRRVVEVKIRLNPEASKQVEKFTNLQVQVAIDL
ncbi:ABC exporter membrane fusion protein, DevB family [Gloeothece citriformis PCC 7424]|uniref:ABC exporter membrane fusion protein, DevB family n=1 Tax=Gloeothece citriformis (strain PCC 7424) TaxID=65393 RepID=B7KG49_GLOC7|nr:ABC exporter membrane fusion protein [Gloeothece citriformis]ACK70520.1 ABC exporter membrane fusion protein, DevB family [Gloeothece citriformis PCC 7424]